LFNKFQLEGNMKKIIIAAAIAAVSALIPAQAGPAAGLGQTLTGVLQRPVGTVTDIVRSYPTLTQELAPTGVDFLLLVPAVLRGQPISPNVRTITVPLPGPAFLNQTLINVPNTVRVNLVAGGPSGAVIVFGGR